MSDLHSDKAIERLRQKVKAADDTLHDVLAMVETVSAQQKDINSMNLKLQESNQKISMLGAQLDTSVSARKMQSKEIQILQDKLERSKEECQKLTDLNRAEKAREYEKSLREVEASKDETMKYMKYKDLKIQHLESGAIQHEQKIEMLENVLENQKSKLNELRMELENSQRHLSITNSYLSQNQREQEKLFGRDVEKLETVSSTNEPIRPARKLEKENVMLKKEVQEKEGMLAKLKKDMEEKINCKIHERSLVQAIHALQYGISAVCSIYRK
ncbi:tropomyosin-like isoform X1 [Mercenaria mercenaria]|uniref:tropomyosin-like isoform X1 n=1 Tax=Mercenaria mercenaria TaxID=6596 RepID=UPI00234E93FF|nr:tropomyosin-like isoform X1 [Mercenaria mercenaria]XP_053399700.1 tropomyosin-like isoform X1 [Mercenaria mercenaria]